MVLMEKETKDAKESRDHRCVCRECERHASSQIWLYSCGKYSH